MLFKITRGTRKYFFEIYEQFGHAPSERFASPGVVGVATRPQNGRSRVQTPFSSSPHRPDSICGSPSLQFSGYRLFFRGGKAAGREFNHLPPSNTDVKIEWNHISPPLYALVEDMDDLVAPVVENTFLNILCPNTIVFVPATGCSVLHSGTVCLVL